MKRTDALFQIAGYAQGRTALRNAADPALTGIFMLPSALLGYAANVLDDIFNDHELAEAVRARAVAGKRRR